MISSPNLNSLRPVLAATLAILGLSLCGLFLIGSDAQAQFATEEETQAQRDTWQERYRWLLRDQARIKQNVANLERDYIMSQRRNYPRGANRERLVVEADAQKRELAKVEAEIAGIYAEARAAGIPPGWLSEVEDEDLTVPAAKADEDEPEVDREGRNPLYFEDDN
jgi:hypothetical protein